MYLVSGSNTRRRRSALPLILELPKWYWWWYFGSIHIPLRSRWIYHPKQPTSQYCLCSPGSRDLFQYPIRRLIVRSRKVSKRRNLFSGWYDRSDIWQTPWQQCCRCTCQISKRCHNLNYRSRGFETSRDLTIRRLLLPAPNFNIK